MKVSIEIWQKVWERTSAVVEISEKELEDYPAGKGGIEDYLMERIDSWFDTAYTAYEADLSVSGDTEIVIDILEGAK